MAYATRRPCVHPSAVQFDPATRTGWTFGPNDAQIQQFSYRPPAVLEAPAVPAAGYRGLVGRGVERGP
ncbi:hypothetical protein AB0M29_19220 [Streptomyces sp. NPDC051976]|uniref:hypothetical protein n=1 Tax=Streptomyces sp. NPDC051976 TaxID=3154947 RepID=UPI003432976C